MSTSRPKGIVMFRTHRSSIGENIDTFHIVPEDVSMSMEQQQQQPPVSTGPPPSAHVAGTLAFFDQIIHTPPRAYAQRADLYQQLFAHIKKEAINEGGLVQPTPPSTQNQQESPTDIEYIVKALPPFFRLILADIQLKPETIVDPLTTSSAAPSSTPPTSSAIKTELARLSRAAVRALGYFLHHPTFCKHFPLATTEVTRKITTIQEENEDGMVDVAAAGGTESNSSSPIDGIKILIDVLSITTDRPTAVMICWVFAEQALPPATMAPYLNSLMDAYVMVMERLQRAILTNPRPNLKPIDLAPLRQEILHALSKFARTNSKIIKERYRLENSSKSLEWFRSLVLQPFLNPTFYFDTSSKATNLDLKKFALDLLELCIGPISFDSMSTGETDFMLTDVVSNSNIYDFCTSCQRMIHEQGWVPQVIKHVQTKSMKYEEDMKVALANEMKTTAAHELPKSSGGATVTATSASAAIVPPPSSHARVEYEAQMVALYTEAFTLLNCYLNCMGRAATLVIPTTSLTASTTASTTGTNSQMTASSAPVTSSTATAASKTSAAAKTDAKTVINEFLAFYQPLFQHPLPSIRTLVFTHAWKNICRVLTVEERVVPQVKLETDTPESQLAAAQKRQISLTLFGKKSMLPLAMKPFLHTLGKEKDPGRVAYIMKTWIEVLVANFMNKAIFALPSSTPASVTSIPTGSSIVATHPPLAHRLLQKSVYDECVGKMLKQLLSTKLPFEAHGWDSHMRARMYDEILIGLRWSGPMTPAAAHAATPALAAAASPSASTSAAASHLPPSGLTPGTAGTSNTSSSVQTNSTNSSSNSSGNSATPGFSPPPAARWLPILFDALLSQPISTPTRQSFLNLLVQFVTKSILRIMGLNEKKSWLTLYQHLLELSVKQALPADLRSMSPPPGTPILSAPSPAVVIIQTNKIFTDPLTLLQALYYSWQSSSASISTLLTVLPSSTTVIPSNSTASTSTTATPAQPQLNERQSQRLQLALVVQLNTLQAWLNIRMELESLVRNGLICNEDGEMSYVRGSPLANITDAGYNATPTPCSAPSTSPPMTISPVLICLFVRWIHVCSPVLHADAIQIIPYTAQEKMREIFLEGVTALLNHHLATVSHATVLQQTANCLRVFMDLILKLSRTHPHHSNACFLVWQFLVKSLSHLVDSFMPVVSPLNAADGGSQSAPSPGSSIGEPSLESGMVGTANSDTKSSKAPVDQFASSFSSGILHPQVANDDMMTDVSIKPSGEVKESLMDLFIYSFLSVMHFSNPPPFTQIDWMATSTTCSARILQLAINTTNVPHSDQPDVMLLLVQSLLDCQKSFGSSASAAQLSSSSGRPLFIQFISSLISQLHPSALLAARLSSPACSSSANWKQWKSHPDTLIQRLVNGVLEEVKNDAPVEGPLTPPTHYLSFFAALTQLFGRFPHSASCIDAVAWFLRLAPGFYSLLSLLDRKPTVSPANSPHNLHPSFATSATELWSQALTAFRKNYHGEFDFQLLQTVLGKIMVPTVQPQATVTSKPLLFIDLLAFTLQHSLPTIRSTGVHYWTHSYASKRSGQIPIATLRFSAYPEFVNICQILVRAGELKSQHMPLVASPPQLPVSPSTTITATSVPNTPATNVLQVPNGSPSLIPNSISPTRGDQPSPTAVAGDNNEMEVDGADDMGLTSMLNEAPHKPLPPVIDIVSSGTKNTRPSPHTPTSSVKSFLPGRPQSSKKANLLDRLADIHALPPEPTILASPTPATRNSIIIGASPSLATSASGSGNQQQEESAALAGQSTLSPFPITPAVGGSPPVPSSMSTNVPPTSPATRSIFAQPQPQAPLQRAVSELAPRILMADFEAAASSKSQPQLTTNEVKQDDVQPMDTSVDAEPTISAVQPAAVVIQPAIVVNETNGPALPPLPSTPHTPVSKQYSQPVGSPSPSTPLPLPLPDDDMMADNDEGDDDLPQSLSLPIGSSFSQLPPQPPESETESEDDLPQATVTTTVTNEPQAAPRVVYKVDSVCSLVGTSVHEDYDAMLNQINIGSAASKFYRIQVLKSEDNYYCWTHWGCVGEEGQSGLESCGSSVAAAISTFEKKFKDKTANDWADRDRFVKKNGKYDLVTAAHVEDPKNVPFEGENAAAVLPPLAIPPSTHQSQPINMHPPSSASAHVPTKSTSEPNFHPTSSPIGGPNLNLPIQSLPITSHLQKSATAVAPLTNERIEENEVVGVEAAVESTHMNEVVAPDQEAIIEEVEIVDPIVEVVLPEPSINKDTTINPTIELEPEAVAPTAAVIEKAPSVVVLPPIPAQVAVAVRQTSPKKVQFCETKNIEISPSPSFSTYNTSCSEEQASHPINQNGPTLPDQAPMDEEDDDKEERKEGVSMEDEDRTQSKVNRRKMREEKLQAYESKKAQLKLQANPSTSTVTSPTKLPSILKSPQKSPQKLYDSAKKAKEAVMDGSESEVSPLYPPLIASLAPLTQLQSHFPRDIAKSFIEFFSHHQLVTIGDVATTPATSFQSNLPIALRLYVAQQTHAGGEMLSVQQLITNALISYEHKQQEKKRKADEQDPEEGKNDATNENGHVNKKTKLVGPIESLQTTQQQEAWLEKMMFNSGASSAPSSSAATQLQLPPSALTMVPSHPPISATTTTAAAAVSSSSQALSCGSEGANQASPITPFVAPDLTSTPHLPTMSTSRTMTVPIPKLARQTTPTKQPPAVAPTVTMDNGIPIPMIVDPSMIGAPASAITPPTPMAASDSPPVLSTAVPITVRPVAHLATNTMMTTALTAPIATSHLALGPLATPVEHGMVDLPADQEMVGAADADMMDAVATEEPMPHQMNELRFHLRSSMAMLFTPVQPQPITPTNGPTTATTAAIPSFSVNHFNVVQHLSLPQLIELQSCLQTMNVAIQQQVTKLRRRSIGGGNTTTTSKPTTPTKTNSRLN